ncbi:MAG: hypothetical protein LBC71_01315 [Oscillospiraceae bacterium]|jgi:hypothetical protein|nr:hypothetical protein [Oscillospiraceae bacterium]
MFFRKNEKIKKRVVCPIPVLIDIIQECIDINAGSSEFVIQFEGKEYKVGFNSDYNMDQGFFNPIFYLDKQEFDSFDKFVNQAILNDRLFADRTDNVEVLDADDGVVKFPWYKKLEDYVVELKAN